MSSFHFSPLQQDLIIYYILSKPQYDMYIKKRNEIQHLTRLLSKTIDEHDKSSLQFKLNNKQVYFDLLIESMKMKLKYSGKNEFYLFNY